MKMKHNPPEGVRLNKGHAKGEVCSYNVPTLKKPDFQKQTKQPNIAP
jgi:hypothetical protein